jgi:lysophospholipase L1-like esterase
VNVSLPVLPSIKYLLAAAASVAALVLGSAHGNALAAVPSTLVVSALDAVFEASFLAEHATPAPEPVGLRDGRSAVNKRWQPVFETFERSDRAQAPSAGGVVFVGSSSISLWDDLAAQFPKQHVVQRGLGGARMADLARYTDRLVLPYRPRVVVVYAGDNDLAMGDKPEAIVAACDALVRQVHRALPEARIKVMSIKPSPSRDALLPQVRQTNDLLEAYAKTHERVDFVNVFTTMLDGTGHARAELFRSDALHLNPAGYALWREALATHLE